MTDDDQIIHELRAARRRHVDRLTRRRRRLAELNGEHTGYIFAAPIRTKLVQMAELGWSFDALAAFYGNIGSATALNMIATGTGRRCNRKFAPIADTRITLAVPESVGDNMWVPALGATRRVRALLAIGWRHSDISAEIGRSSTSFATGEYLRTRAIDWRVVEAAFDSMSASRGSSVRCINRSRARGYAVPFAWDDIDNPFEQPRTETQSKKDQTFYDQNVVDRLINEGKRTRQLTHAEAAAAVRILQGRGMSNQQISRRYGFKPERYNEINEAASS